MQQKVTVHTDVCTEEEGEGGVLAVFILDSQTGQRSHGAHAPVKVHPQVDPQPKTKKTLPLQGRGPQRPPRSVGPWSVDQTLLLLPAPITFGPLLCCLVRIVDEDVQRDRRELHQSFKRKTVQLLQTRRHCSHPRVGYPAGAGSPWT